MRRTFWMIIAAFAVWPLTAQVAVPPSDAPPPACTAQNAAPQKHGSYTPLAAYNRLFHVVPAASVGELKIEYSVDGALQVSEIVDLKAATQEVRRLTPRARRIEIDGEEAQRVTPAKMIFELLALNPDALSALEQQFAAGRQLRVEFIKDGRVMESASFPDLIEASKQALNGKYVSLKVHSSVTGVASVPKRMPHLVIRATDYLPNCGDCNTSTPCDTECGYDPGKGGPVTCGEYGVCIGSGCACEVSAGDQWTDWYPVSRRATGYSECFELHDATTTHVEVETLWRRDLVRYTWTCPYCPECYGCYGRNEVVDYQYGVTDCMGDTGMTCFSGTQPWCAWLCSYERGCI